MECLKSENKSQAKLSNAIIDIHNIDSPVIVWKIENSLKKGKSTAPESDGIT